MANKSKSKSPAPQETRYPSHPMLSLWDDMDRMFSRYFRTPMAAGAFARDFDWPAKGQMMPDVDVKETDKSIVISAELPGMEEKDVELSVANGYLTLKGEKKEETEKDEEDRHITERRYGSFRRTFPIGEEIEADKISAKFDKGVLKITLPKNHGKSEKKRKITIG
jgi:HSP20 family protein